MLPEKIYRSEWEVETRLKPFGFTKAELLDVVRRTFAERSNTTELDISGAAGTLAYLHGTRHLRVMAAKKGYLIDRSSNIEACAHPAGKLFLAYQNVDYACVMGRSPKANSSKGAGSTQVLNNAQGVLFNSKQLPHVINLNAIQRLNRQFWYLCVSYSEEAFSAELSLPTIIDGANFGSFVERIFIVEGQQWFGKASDTTRDDIVEMEPIVRRKKL